jgi:hypothetical protein
MFKKKPERWDWQCPPCRWAYRARMGRLTAVNAPLQALLIQKDGLAEIFKHVFV